MTILLATASWLLGEACAAGTSDEGRRLEHSRDRLSRRRKFAFVCESWDAAPAWCIVSVGLAKSVRPDALQTRHRPVLQTQPSWGTMRRDASSALRPLGDARERKPMKRIAFALGLGALLSSHSASAIKVPTGSDDINLNINLLLQPRFEVTFDRTTPDKSADFDFYIRRGRIQVSATAYKMFSFMIQTDNSNWGRAGNLANNQGNGQPFIIQDLLVSFTPIEDFTIDTGLILEPGIRIGSYSASGGQGIVETPTALILDNNAKGFREMGAQLRGFLLARRIHYRVGIWEGVHNQAETASTGAAVAGGPAANPSGKPMLGGHVRFNIIGEETGYAFNQMYLDGKTRASVGFATQFQKHGACAVGLGVTPAGSSVTTAVPPTGVPPNTTVCNLTGPVSTAGTTVADYKMFAGDAFFDAALPGDMEFAVD